MRKQQRTMLQLVAAIVACAAFSIADSHAQAYPAKAVRLIIGFAPGGATDIVARLVAQKLSENLGQSVVVENRTGAGGTIATERVATSPPDGYTLLLLTSAEPAQGALRRLTYNLQRDFAPVSLVATGVLVLVVHPSVPARNVKELLTLARAQPGKLSYGSLGAGSQAHLSGELLNLMAKVKLLHVPYKGSSEAVLATATGQIDMSFPTITGALPLLEVGKLRAFAVTTAKRASLLPSVPTLDESGLPGYDLGSWSGIVVPTGVPAEIVTRLNAVIGKAFNTPEMKESLTKLSLEARTTTPEQFAAHIRSEIDKNAKLVQLSGAKAE